MAPRFEKTTTPHQGNQGLTRTNTILLFKSGLTASDLVVVLGGPIGVYEEEQYPFVREELSAIRARMEAAKPTLGICLGAQLMAKARGAKDTPNNN